MAIRNPSEIKIEKTPSPARDIIEINDVWEEFRIYSDRRTSFKDFLISFKRSDFSKFWALKNISFKIKEGDVFGIIGENGSGKSTLLKCMASILTPSKGSINIHGKIAPMLELGAGFESDLTGRENIYLNSSILGISKKEIIKREQAIIDFAELQEFIDSPIKNYSSGMKVRLGFAVAINVDPDILLIDEVLAVGDASFQAKCLEKLDEFRRKGKTIVYVSHALGSVEKLCTKAAWLHQGQLQIVGEVEKVLDAYQASVEAKRAKSLGKAQQNIKGRSRAHTSKNRWGTGEVDITSVDLRDANGEITQIFETGGEMIVELSYNAKQRIEEPQFGVALFNSTGVRVWGQISGNNVGPIEGQGLVRFSVKYLSLLPGNYFFSCAVRATDSNTHFDFHEKLYVFDIVSHDKEVKFSNGLVLVASEWAHLPKNEQK